MKKHRWLLLAGIVLIVSFSACQRERRSSGPGTGAEAAPETTVSGRRPDSLFFSGDSAYAYVKRQVLFGPRVPGTESHARCADWLVAFLRQYADTVMVQRGTVTRFDGKPLPIRNIIASLGKGHSRWLLLAHWDTRPWADQDSVRREMPIAGADDGASGVAVLLELARIWHRHPPRVPVDILLVDAEDQGPPAWRTDLTDRTDFWALGTQYWLANPHQPLRLYQGAILLDMVGARNASFMWEGLSRQAAPDLLQQIWRIADRLGYGYLFVPSEGPPVTDDHYFLIQAGLPAIDIIHLNPTTPHYFPPHWHTHADTLTVISPHTLEAVGRTLEYWSRRVSSSL